MVGFFSIFSVRSGHRRSQSALDLRDVLPPSFEVTSGSNLASSASAATHGVEIAVEFKPVERPTEPLDNDQPIQCPLPEPSILNSLKTCLLGSSEESSLLIHVEASTPPASLSTPSYSSSHPANSMPPTVNLEEDDAFATPMSNQAPSSPKRPMGVKAAKEAKKKGKKGMTPTNERAEALNRIAANQESYGRNHKDSDAIEVSLMRERIALQKKDIQLRDLAEETRIMSMDTESMTPKSKRYFTKRKAEILSQLDGVEEEASKEGYSNCYRPLFPST